MVIVMIAAGQLQLPTSFLSDVEVTLPSRRCLGFEYVSVLIY